MAKFKALFNVKGVPMEEMVMAELIQTAEHKGYHADKGHYCDGKKGVCAVGCLMKSRNVLDDAIEYDARSEIIQGNDGGRRDTPLNLVGDTFYQLFEGANNV